MLKDSVIDSWWLRHEREARACPACRSSRIALLDTLPFRADASQPGVGFLTGCRDCGLLFANPLPRPEELATFYDQQGRWADERRARARRVAAAYARRIERNKAPRKLPAVRLRAALLERIR